MILKYQMKSPMDYNIVSVKQDSNEAMQTEVVENELITDHMKVQQLENFDVIKYVLKFEIMTKKISYSDVQIENSSVRF